MIHITRYGDEIPIEQMSDNHLLKHIELIERRAKYGLYINKYHIYSDPIPENTDVEFLNQIFLKGEQVKGFMNYEYYKRELQRRKL